MAKISTIIARAKAEIGTEAYRVDIKAGSHPLIADEPLANGGGDRGPAPYELLLSALAGCTAITLTMYCERKSWALERAEIELRLVRSGEIARVDRTVTLDGILTGEQISRLSEIAERTPVTLTLRNGIEIRTSLRAAASPTPSVVAPAGL